MKWIIIFKIKEQLNYFNVYKIQILKILKWIYINNDNKLINNFISNNVLNKLNNDYKQIS